MSELVAVDAAGRPATISDAGQQTSATTNGLKAPTSQASQSPNTITNSNQSEILGAEQDNCDDDCWKDATDTIPLVCDQLNNFEFANNNDQYQESNNALVGDPLNCNHQAETGVSSNTINELILHKAIYVNDLERILNILVDSKLTKRIINSKDKHGNTPLHLACMLGSSKEVVAALLEAGAQVDIKNLNKWSAFQEACSYGNREIIELLTIQLRQSVHDSLHNENLANKLEKTRNYRLVLKWEFQSWIPFLSRYLPNDLCVINKQGRYIRIDTRITHWETLSWQTGDGTFIYSNKYRRKWVFMDNEQKKYLNFESEIFSPDTNCKIDEFMSIDIMDIELKSSDIQMTRSTKGWFWKSDKMEKIGNYNAALYNFNNVFLVTRKRREHLTANDIKRNKILYKAFLNLIQFGPGTSSQSSNTNGNNNNNTAIESPEVPSSADLEHLQESLKENHRPSLPPPEPNKLTWQEYLDCEPGTHPALGRQHVVKVVNTAFKASVAISEEFPIDKSQFLDLLSIVPLKLFKKLKDFIELRLPDGFPIRLDVPLLPFLSARVTFEDFNFIDGPIDESLFSVPTDYVEDKDLFARFGNRQNRHQQQQHQSGGQEGA